MKKILITINDDFLKQVYKDVFQKSQFEVLEADDENETFSIISKEIPDVALLDVDLAEKNDFELLKKIRKEESTKRIPIILFSRMKEDNYKEAIVDFEIKDFIVTHSSSPIEVLNKVKIHLSTEKTYRISVDNQAETIKNLADDLGYDSLLCKKCSQPLKLYLIRDLSKGSNYFKVSFVCTDC